jgi:hypothetical protein
MKTLPLSLLLIIGLAATFHCQQPSEKEQIRKANVKSVSVAGIRMRRRIVSDYDRRGNLIRRIEFGPTGSPLSQESYKYDEKDNVIESVAGGKKQTYVYKYNSNGQVLEARQFDSDGMLKQRTEYVLDGAGQVIETISYLGTGQRNARSVSRRDADGNVVEYSRYGADGKLVERHLHTYQGKNTVRQTQVFGPGGELTSRITYEYDGDRLIRQTTYGTSGDLLRRNTYRRDQKGLVVEDLRTNGKGEPVDRTTLEYEFYP